MTRHQSEETRRAAITVAAQRVFARVGFDRANLDEVARLADLGKGTLYLYFESKEVLYHEVVSLAMARWRDPWTYEEPTQTQEARISSASLRSRLSASVDSMSWLSDDVRILSDAWHRASSDRSLAAALAPHRAALHHDITHCIACARFELGRDLADSPARAEVLLAALIGLMGRDVDEATPLGLTSRPQLKEILFELACSSLEPAPKAAGTV